MTCILVVNTYNKAAKLLAGNITSFLKELSHKIVRVDFSGADTPFPCGSYDCAITLGGDGTVLYAARQCAPAAVPVVPVNLGEFGFIAGIDPKKWKTALKAFFAGKMKMSERSLVCAQVVRGGKNIFSGTALNDIVLSGKQAAKTLKVSVSAGTSAFGIFKADALIVATSTGSTAYSAAAGGPIVEPALDVIILNTVCAFSLSTRPLVLPADTRLSVSVLPARINEFVLTLDGQVCTAVQAHDRIDITKAQHPVLLAGCDSAVFYSALRSKLHWSGGPHD